MKVPPSGRLSVPLRLAAGATLVLLTVTGCGAGVNTLRNDQSVPERATSAATAETTPSAETAQPVENSEPTEPTETAGPAQAQTAVQPGGALVDGSTVAAELTRAGQRDKFTLDLGDAREFYVTDMAGDDIQFQVFSEVDGQPISPAGVALSAGTASVKLTKAGKHRLEIFGNTNVIGPYSFRIATVKVRTFQATIGLQIGEGSPAGAGRLDVPGRIDRFEFDADGASAIKIIGGAGACTAIELELTDAAEKNIASPRQPVPLCGYEFDMPLSNGDGRYAIVVRSGTAKTGPYSFQIVRAG
ncbi:hypothetical protein ACFY05_21285 [Microtetraspora fusca]|uniref:Peptidase C-terminal archaeal/bacterial domain-containing protein n=1 Tax=Microtetraspora fusca TaxID=1997 RepID=A0ABW6V7V6_MICFU